MNSVVQGCRGYPGSLSSSLQTSFGNYGITPPPHPHAHRGYMVSSTGVPSGSAAAAAAVHAAAVQVAGTAAGLGSAAVAAACLQRSPSFAIQELLGLHHPGVQPFLSHHHQHHQQPHHSQHHNPHHQLFADDRSSGVYCNYQNFSSSSVSSSSIVAASYSSAGVSQCHSSGVLPPVNQDHAPSAGLLGMTSLYDCGGVPWRTSAVSESVGFMPSKRTLENGRGGGVGGLGGPGRTSELQAAAAEAAAQAAVAAAAASSNASITGHDRHIHHQQHQTHRHGYLSHLGGKNDALLSHSSDYTQQVINFYVFFSSI